MLTEYAFTPHICPIPHMHYVVHIAAHEFLKPWTELFQVDIKVDDDIGILKLFKNTKFND